MCIKVLLTTIKDVQDFIRTASKYEDLTVNSEKSVTTATSLMGILALNLEKPINLCWNNPKISKDVSADFEKWRYKKNE